MPPATFSWTISPARADAHRRSARKVAALDTALILVLFLVILGLIVGAAFLRGWVRRSASSAGERAGARYTAARMEEILADLGATLLVHASPTATAELLRVVVAERGRSFSLLPDGALGVRFVEPDDTVARLVPRSGGTLLRVETFREYLGFPQTAPLWRELRALAAAEAAIRGIEVGDGPVSVFERGPELDDRNARWFRV
ncbi:hypothetical protein [Microbacterium sp. K36]|uniref:hypothetical protein n=1 Tax=Microbacterium sp. K36 TaxID=2305439 RepID=UPI00109CD9E9|nr:hypothetical protein [Microbacterium sp. K36]